jgi:hypothetical protein
MILDKLFAVSVFGMQYFEAHFKDKDGVITVKNVKLSTLKELGVTKTLRGTKKFREWALSEDGQNYLFGVIVDE